ncbi:hypothetical protein WME90_05305 [Sorangium sp. So ce375]|uniref:hypothetical protein n=1 Tax=Sorangium sp. So ce375 TaxID=3133306 RepID=UPI003F5BD7FA
MDDDELLRALTRIAQRDPTADPRWRRLAEGSHPEDARGAPGDTADTAAPSITEREEREARTPLDDETRARLADQLLAQLREPRGDAPAPPPRPAVDRKSGIRFRCPQEWDCDAEEACDVTDAPTLGADADSLSGTSSPSTSDAPVCRAINGESVPPEISASEPPRGTHPSAAPDQRSTQGAQDGANGARPPRGGLVYPELVVERRGERRTTPAARARAVVGVAGWVVAVALVSLLALRPAPFAPGAAPLPEYTIATTLGDGPQQGDREPGAPRHVGRGARLTIALSPDARVPAPVAVRAYLVQGGSARPWSVDVALDGAGGAHISGTREALFRDVAGGPCEVVLEIGHPDALPGPAEALPDEGAVHLAGGRLLRQRLFLD